MALLFSQRVLLPVTTFAIIVVFIELASFFVVCVFEHTGVFYDPSFVTQSYPAYLAKRDLNLGWGPPQRAAVDGARNDPDFPVTAEPCVSLFGDSFTWSSEVSDKDSWGAILATKLKCRVSNYGVGGYGSDQALMRYRSVSPKGKIVFLNHVSENILRNVNEYRNLLYPGREFVLKPRFLYEGGGVLKAITLPNIPANNISEFKNDPSTYLHHEFFLPGGQAGVQTAKFPYTIALIKAIFSNYRISAILQNKPRYTDFYSSRHPSGALDVTYWILRSFVNEAIVRGQVPIVTIIPTCEDLNYFNRKAVFPYAPLIEMIVSNKIRYIDFGKEIIERLHNSPPVSLYQDCSGHFNAQGYLYLADIAFEYLRADPELSQLLSSPPTNESEPLATRR